MKTIITTLCLFLMGLMASAQKAENREITTFRQIDATNVQVVFTVSPHTSLALAALDADTAQVSTTVQNGVLTITGHGSQSNEVKVYVSGPRLDLVKLKEHAGLRMHGNWDGEQAVVRLETGSRFTGSLTAKQVYVYANDATTANVQLETNQLWTVATGSAKVCLSGQTESAVLAASGSAYCTAGNLSAAQVKATANDQSGIKVYAVERLDILVSDSAKVAYNHQCRNVRMNMDAQASLSGTERLAIN